MSPPPVRQSVQIAPSLLTADLARLGEEVAALEEAGADRIHWDVMDAAFVPNLTFGPDVVAAARPHCALPFDIHLMVSDPGLLLARWADAGAEVITVHAEACTHLHRTLESIAALGVTPGVALNPATPVESIAHVLDLVGRVLVMTVNPGFGGQSYLRSMEPKIAAVRAMVQGYEIGVEADGGIAPGTIAGAWAAGVSHVVSGSALYRDPDGLAAAVTALRSACGETAAVAGRTGA